MKKLKIIGEDFWENKMDITKLFSGLKLNRIRNLIIYASFIALIVSLIFPMQGLDNSFVQKASLSFFFYGLFLWAIENLAFVIVDEFNDEGQQILFALWILVGLIGFYATFKIVFDISILDIIFPKT